MYANTEQLVATLFRTIGDQLDIQIEDSRHKDTKKLIGDALEALGILLSVGEFSPIGSQYFAKFSKLFRWTGGRLGPKHPAPPKPLSLLKDELSAALRLLPQRVFVVVDDLDRLEPEPLARVLQLVRLTASFDNLTYVLCFDRTNVERAIEGQLDVPGRDYLEKIIQVNVDLPSIDDSVLHGQLTASLNDALGGALEDDVLHLQWVDLMRSGLSDLVTTPRDVIRYVNAVSLTYGLIASEVNLLDFLGVESLRVFAPSLYEFVRTHGPAILGPRSLLESQVEDSEAAKREVESGYKGTGAGPDTPERKLLQRLFPQLRLLGAASRYSEGELHRWRQARRVCSHEFFPRYFLLGVPAGEVSEAEIIGLLKLADVAQIVVQLENYIGSGRAGRLLERMEDHVPNVPAASLEAWIYALLDIGDSVSLTADAILEGDQNMQVQRLLYQLLQRAEPRVQRLAVLESAITQARGIGTLCRFGNIIEPDHDRTDDELFSGEDWARIRQGLVVRIEESADDGSLAARPGAWLGLVLHRWKDWAGLTAPKEFVDSLVATDEGLLILLGGFRLVSLSSGGAGTVRHPYIGRESLTPFVDPAPLEPLARKLLDERRDSLSQEHIDLLKLFLSGYDPMLH